MIAVAATLESACRDPWTETKSPVLITAGDPSWGAGEPTGPAPGPPPDRIGVEAPYVTSTSAPVVRSRTVRVPEPVLVTAPLTTGGWNAPGEGAARGVKEGQGDAEGEATPEAPEAPPEPPVAGPVAGPPQPAATTRQALPAETRMTLQPMPPVWRARLRSAWEEGKKSPLGRG